MAATASNPLSPVPLDTIPLSPATNGTDSHDGAATKKSYPEGEEITVFHDKDNFNVKHPLMNKWTLWYTKPPSQGGKDNWAELLKEVVTFDSVEEFWGVYNNIAPTSTLGGRSDYHLFKQGIRPEWEDPQNKAGGKWSYTWERSKGSDKNVNIDEIWLFTMLAAIGETLEGAEDKEVMGVVVNARAKFYRIGVWTKTQGKGGDKAKSALMALGKKFKETIKIDENTPVEFNAHTDAANAGSTRAKAKYVA